MVSFSDIQLLGCGAGAEASAWDEAMGLGEVGR